MRNDRIDIEHTEHLTDRNPEFASPLRRLSAFLIDTAIISLIVAVFALDFDSESFTAKLDLRYILIWSGYMIISERVFQRTVGKWLLRIRVVSANSPRISLRAAVIRNLIKWPEVVWFMIFWPFWVLFVALVDMPMPGWISGGLRAIWSPYKQRWGDELAKTYVIKGPWTPIRVEGRNVGPTADYGSKSGIRLSKQAQKDRKGDGQP